MTDLARHEIRLRQLFAWVLGAPLAGAAALAGACRSSSAPDACASETVQVDAQLNYCGQEQVPFCEAGSPCETYISLPCGLPKGVEPRTDCYLSVNDCQTLCPQTPFTCLAFGDWCTDGGELHDAGP